MNEAPYSDNSIREFDKKEWIIEVYNPSKQLRINGRLKIDKNLYSFFGNDDSDMIACFPSQNVAYCASSEVC